MGTTTDGHPRRRAVLAVLVSSLFVVVLDTTILNVALRVIGDPVQGLGASQGELQWTINSYTLVFAGLLFVWGTAGDRFGRRKLLLVGLLVFAAASAASAFATTPGQLIAARAAMGVGAASVMPLSLATIVAVFPPQERGRAIGLWSAAVGAAITVGPIVGGALLEHFWWGSVFLVNVPVAAAALVATLLLVPESRDPAPGRVDLAGAVLVIGGLVAVVYGIIRGGELASWGSAAVWGSIALGVLLLAAFVRVQRRAANPSLDLGLFRDRRFAAAVVAVLVVFFGLMGVTFFTIFYLQVVRGLSPLMSGVCLLPLAVAQLVVSPRSAAVVARFGARATVGGGLVGVAVCFAAYLLVGARTPLWVLLTVLFVQGVAMALVVPPSTVLNMAAVPAHRAGMGSAVNNTVRQVGGALGVAVLGTVLTTAYRQMIGPVLDLLPEPLRAAASVSVQATYGAIDEGLRSGVLSPADADRLRDALSGPASDAFVQAMHYASGVAGAAALAGAVVVLVLLRARPRVTAPTPAGAVVGGGV